MPEEAGGAEEEAADLQWTNTTRTRAFNSRCVAAEIILDLLIIIDLQREIQDNQTVRLSRGPCATAAAGGANRKFLHVSFTNVKYQL